MSPGPQRTSFFAGARVIYARELGAMFDSSIAYVTIIGFLLLSTSLYMNEFFLAGRLDLTPFFTSLPALSVLFVPALTMRLWAEERRARTFEVLVTLPLTPLQIVLGKFLAACSLYALFLVGTLPLVVMLIALGEPDLGLIFAGYLGALCLGALLIAVGALFSALSSDQIVAFILSALVSFVLVASGEERVVAVLDGLAPALGAGTWLAGTVSLLPPYESFVRGFVELPALVYFGGLSTVLLWWNAVIVERSRA